MTDAWHLPLSLSHLSPCSPAVGLPLLSDTSLTPYCVTSCTHSWDTHSRLHPSLPSHHLKTEERRDVSFTTKVETHPRRHLPFLLLFRHGVNTNEEKMSPLLCPHLSQWPRDMHTHPCLSVSASLTLLSHTYPVIISIMIQCYNTNIIITSLTKMAVYWIVSYKLDR